MNFVVAAGSANDSFAGLVDFADFLVEVALTEIAAGLKTDFVTVAVLVIATAAKVVRWGLENPFAATVDSTCPVAGQVFLLD